VRVQKVGLLQVRDLVGVLQLLLEWVHEEGGLKAWEEAGELLVERALLVQKVLD
jgi:hypothetical protein